MNREIHVRICERLGVKFPGATRQSITKWDDNKLVTITKMDTTDGAVENRQSWELADAGKQMVVTRNFTGPHGKNDTRSVFTALSENS